MNWQFYKHLDLTPGTGLCDYHFNEIQHHPNRGSIVGFSLLGIEVVKTTMVNCHAMGVGLGFGLQEILPQHYLRVNDLYLKARIRIESDTVTIRNLTGNISKNQYASHHAHRLG